MIRVYGTRTTNDLVIPSANSRNSWAFEMCVCGEGGEREKFVQRFPLSNKQNAKVSRLGNFGTNLYFALALLRFSPDEDN